MELSPMGGQRCLHNGDLIKTLDTRARTSFPGWPYSRRIITCQYWESWAAQDSTGRAALCLESLCLELSWALPYVPLPLADFNPCPLAVINHATVSKIAHSEFCESL